MLRALQESIVQIRQRRLVPFSPPKELATLVSEFAKISEPYRAAVCLHRFRLVPVPLEHSAFVPIDKTTEHPNAGIARGVRRGFLREPHHFRVRTAPARQKIFHIGLSHS